MRHGRAAISTLFCLGLGGGFAACVSDSNAPPSGVDELSIPSLDSGQPSNVDAGPSPASDATSQVDASDGATTDASPSDAGGHPLMGVVAISGPGMTTNNASTAFCAILSDGSARCWGSNAYGQIGLGVAGSPPNATFAVAPTGLASGVTAIAVGDDHVCAIQAVEGGTSTLCWGDNTYGQLGTGADAGTYGPTVVAALAGASAIASGGGASCATISTEAYCWGANVYGNVCDDSSGVQTTPYFIDLSVDQVALGLHGLGLSSGNVFSWGRNDYGQLGRTSTEQCTAANTACDQNYSGSAISADASAIAVGGFHSCAIVSGQAECFGDDRSGQLGDGTPTASPVPTPVPVQGLAGVPVQLALGWQSTCALITGGTVQCWGDESIGEGDAGEAGIALTPVTVLTGATAIAAGDYTACALMSDTTVKCWGRNAEGELGIGSTDSLPHAPTTVREP